MKKRLSLFLAVVSAVFAAAPLTCLGDDIPKINKQTFGCIRADVVRKRDRGWPERLCGFYGLIWHPRKQSCE